MTRKYGDLNGRPSKAPFSKGRDLDLSENVLLVHSLPFLEEGALTTGATSETLANPRVHPHYPMVPLRGQNTAQVHREVLSPVLGLSLATWCPSWSGWRSRAVVQVALLL